MTWTYHPSLETNRDKVRLLIGDTDTNNQLLEDEELCFLQSEFGSATDIYSTALAAIDVALAELARKADSKSVGPLSLSYTNRIRNLERARARVEGLARRKLGAPTPYAGGIRISDKAVDEQDTDINDGFKIGMFDNPGGANNTGNDFTDLYDRDEL